MKPTRSWDLWAKMLCLEGGFLLSLGIGWALGRGQGPESPWVPVFVLCGAGLVSAVVGVSLWSALKRKKLRAFLPGRAVRLEEVFGALRRHGRQPPICETPHSKTTALRIGPGEKLPLEIPGDALLEIWAGSLILVLDGERRSLGYGDILRLSADEVRLAANESEEETFVLLHLLG